MDTCETIQEKLSAYVDGELTQQESQLIDVHLQSCSDCRAACEDFARLRQDIKRLGYPEATDTDWSNVMAGFTFKASRGVGWLLWIAGAVVLVAYAIYEFVSDPAVEALQRIAVLAVILGVVLVFLTVAVERIARYRHDKFKDVQK